MSEADRGLICPACLSEAVERLISTFATTGCGGGQSRFT